MKIKLTTPIPNPSAITPKRKTIKKSEEIRTPQLLKREDIKIPIKINFNISSIEVHLES